MLGTRMVLTIIMLRFFKLRKVIFSWFVGNVFAQNPIENMLIDI